MAKQLPVTALTLPQAVFHDAEYQAAAVNLFCGRNGTGKTTIARCLRGGRYVTAVQKDSMPQITVFDAEYVSQNLRKRHGLPGIWTLSRADAALETALAEQNRQRILAEAELRAAAEQITPLKETEAAVFAAFAETVWAGTETLRARYPLALRGGKDPAAFAKALRYTSPHAFDPARLDRMYRMAFGAEMPLLPLLPQIADTCTLDMLAEDPVLDEVFTLSGDAQFQQFLAALGHADWLHAGYEQFSEKAGGLCPYCGQPLPAELSARLAAAFDSAYQQGIRRITALEAAYRKAANAVCIPLMRMLRQRIPGLDYHRFEADLRLLRSLLRENLAAIREKRAHPAEPAVLTAVTEVLRDLNADIDTLNAAILRRNRYVTERDTMQEKCRSCVMSCLADRMRDARETLDAELMRQTAELPGLERRSAELREKLRRCEAETARLSAAVSESQTAAAEINALLRDAGFTGFSLRQSEKHPRAYETVRQNGMAAEHLSEGEQRFLAFLYFYVTAQRPAQHGRILVLDDPFTALDGETAAVVLRLTKALCAQCLRGEKRGIRQIFVMTFRGSCYRELLHDLTGEGAAAVILRKRGDRTVLCAERLD